MSSDVVAVWDVPLNDGVHTVEFEHGTTSGKRVIRIDGKEILRRDWLFRLVGYEPFRINDTMCSIQIDAEGLFKYTYQLFVDGKPLEAFTENQSKIKNSWLVVLEDSPYRIVLEKGTLDVWVNGVKIETAGEFTDIGSEIYFKLGEYPAYIRANPTYTKKDGILYTLFVNEDIIEPNN